MKVFLYMFLLWYQHGLAFVPPKLEIFICSFDIYIGVQLMRFVASFWNSDKVVNFSENTDRDVAFVPEDEWCIFFQKLFAKGITLNRGSRRKNVIFLYGNFPRGVIWLDWYFVCLYIQFWIYFLGIKAKRNAVV